METGCEPVRVGAWPLHWAGVPRPFVHPVTSPSGEVLSTDAPADHPWHHALWFTIKYVNGENFWEEYDDYGLLVPTGPPELEDPGDGSTLARSSIDWMRPGPDGPGSGGRVLREELVVRFSTGHGLRIMDWDVSLTPDVAVTLDRTPFTTWGGYGGLTFRGRSDWHDTSLMLDDGAGVARVLGTPSRWCSLQGRVTPSDDTAGLVIMDHPDNPGFPNCWYASTRADTYGDDGWSNFANAAFLWDGPLELAGGEVLRMRHRVATHDGARSTEQLAGDWDRWLSEAPL